jgi:hypothetical protein
MVSCLKVYPIISQIYLGLKQFPVPCDSRLLKTCLFVCLSVFFLVFLYFDLFFLSLGGLIKQKTLLKLRFLANIVSFDPVDLEKEDRDTRGSVGWACVAHLSFCFKKTLYQTFHRCFLPNYGSFGYSLSEQKIFLEITRKKNCLWWPCLLTDRDEMSNLYRGPSIDASY